MAIPRCLGAIFSLGSETHRKQLMVFHRYLAQEWFFFPVSIHSLRDLDATAYHMRQESQIPGNRVTFHHLKYMLVFTPEPGLFLHMSKSCHQ